MGSCDKLNAVFPGTFDPPTRGHMETIAGIVRQNPDIGRLVVAIPVNRTGCRQRILSDAAVVWAMRLSLDEFNLKKVEVAGVDLSHGWEEAWTKCLKSNRVDVVITGNERTAEMVAAMGRTIEVRHFKYGSYSSVTASEARENIRGGREKWKEMVTDAVMKCIQTQPLAVMDRW